MALITQTTLHNFPGHKKDGAIIIDFGGRKDQRPNNNSVPDVYPNYSDSQRCGHKRLSLEIARVKDELKQRFGSTGH